MNTISVHLMGGLGNQLFQIFFLLSYCFKYNHRFIFSMKEYENERRTYWDDFLKCLRPYLVPDAIVQQLPLYYEKTFEHTEYEDMGSNLCFYGYFQSWKYFYPYREKIVQMIGMPAMISTIKDIDSNSISLHFRIGDYKQKPDCHPILSTQYYMNSLDYIRSKYPNIRYEVFYFYEKEDEQTVKDKISRIQDQFVDYDFINGTEIYQKDWEQLLFMIKCHHHIIANSSFSWWGAFMSDHSDSITTYPDIWFGPKIPVNVDDLFLPGWIKISG